MSDTKVIFLDVDSSIRSKKEMLSPHIRDVITNLRNKGIKVILMTSGNFLKAKKIVKEINADPYLICCNGAYVYDLKSQKEIFSSSISSKTILDLYDYSKNHNVSIRAITSNKEFILNDNNLLLSSPTFQLTMTSSNFNRMITIPHMFNCIYDDIKVTCSSEELHQSYVKEKIEFFHDITNRQVSKSRGIVELLDYLNIPQKKSLAVIGEIEDLPLCELELKCITTNDAPLILKENVADVTNLCHNSGVMDYLNQKFELGMEL